MNVFSELGARPLSLTVAVGLLLFLISVWIKLVRSQNQSNFRKYEFENQGSDSIRRIGVSANSSDQPMHQGPLRLEGFSIHRPAHEILGVSMTASEREIQSAFKKLMLRFHPDRVGPQDSREWRDAQPIAEAIIQAKDAMLGKKQKRA